MIAPADGLLRLTRAGAFALTAVALSLAGHVAAGGRSPGTVMVLLLAGVCVLPAVWLTARQRRLPSLVAALGAGEFLLHHAFMALSGTATCHVVHGSGHASHAAALHCTRMADPAAMSGMAGGGHLSPPMLLAHVLATIALALLLAHGERVVWSLCGWLRAAVPPLPGPALVPAARRTDATRSVRTAPSRLRPGSVSRRGPPGLFATG